MFDLCDFTHCDFFSELLHKLRSTCIRLEKNISRFNKTSKIIRLA
jgi:hypothetical protein